MTTRQPEGWPFASHLRHGCSLRHGTSATTLSSASPTCWPDFPLFRISYLYRAYFLARLKKVGDGKQIADCCSRTLRCSTTYLMLIPPHGRPDEALPCCRSHGSGSQEGLLVSRECSFRLRVCPSGPKMSISSSLELSGQPERINLASA
jgi:hypothetical protein